MSGLGSVVSLVAIATLWAQPGYGPAQRSFNPKETAIAASNVAALAEDWRVALGVHSHPVIAGNRIFVASGDTIHALNARSGREIWSFTHPLEQGFPVSFLQPMIPGGLLAVPLSWIAGGGLSIHDLRTGAHVSGGPELQAGVLGRVVRGHEVAQTRAELVSGGPVAAIFDHPGGSTTFWFFGSFSSAWVGHPVLLRDHAYVTVLGVVHGFRADRCDHVPPWSGCAPAFSADVDADWLVGSGGKSLAVVSGSTLIELNGRTGAEHQRTELPAEAVGSPAVAHGRVFVAAGDGNIHAVHGAPCAGEPCDVWTAQVGAPITGRIIVAGDVLYAGTSDGEVLAFDARGCAAATCAPLWRSGDLGGAITKGPVVARGALYAGTDDGALVAFRLPSR